MKLISIDYYLFEGGHVIFKFSDGSIMNGIIKSAGCGVYIEMTSTLPNNSVFDKLGITNAKEFVRSIVDYQCCKGIWPYVRSYKDLEKVLKALGSYDIVPSPKQELNFIRKKSTLKLNFKL